MDVGRRVTCMHVSMCCGVVWLRAVLSELPREGHSHEVVQRKWACSLPIFHGADAEPKTTAMPQYLKKPRWQMSRQYFVHVFTWKEASGASQLEKTSGGALAAAFCFASFSASMALRQRRRRDRSARTSQTLEEKDQAVPKRLTLQCSGQAGSTVPSFEAEWEVETVWGEFVVTFQSERSP